MNVHAHSFPLNQDRDLFVIYGHEADGSAIVVPNEDAARWEYESLFFSDRRDPVVRVVRFNAADGTCRDVTDDFQPEEEPDEWDGSAFDRECSRADQQYDLERGG